MIHSIIQQRHKMNANDFEGALDLFAAEGALQPPFQRPIVGREAILAYDPVEEDFTPIKATGRVQTPLFGASVGMNIAWRFLLNPQGKIFLVAVDLLASLKELLNPVR